MTGGQAVSPLLHPYSPVSTAPEVSRGLSQEATIGDVTYSQKCRYPDGCWIEAKNNATKVVEIVYRNRSWLRGMVAYGSKLYLADSNSIYRLDGRDKLNLLDSFGQNTVKNMVATGDGLYALVSGQLLKLRNTPVNRRGGFFADMRMRNFDHIRAGRLAQIAPAAGTSRAWAIQDSGRIMPLETYVKGKESSPDDM